MNDKFEIVAIFVSNTTSRLVASDRYSKYYTDFW